MTVLRKARFIVFDIGNVVCFGDETICRGLLYNCGVPFLNTAEIYSCHDYYEFLRGRISSQEFHIALVRKYLGYPASYEQVHHAFKMAMYAADQGVVDILSRLDGQSLAFLTDTNVWQDERMRELVALEKYADPSRIFKSHEMGMVKTDEMCFPYVLSQLGDKAEEVLLIDDSSEKVNTAKQHGWQTHRFVNSGELSGYLKNIGYPVP